MHAALWFYMCTKKLISRGNVEVYMPSVTCLNSEKTCEGIPVDHLMYTPVFVGEVYEEAHRRI